MDKKSKVISNLIWRFFERFGAQAVSIVVGIILARKLGPGPAGDIAVIMAVITILKVFADSGMGNALIQTKDPDALDFSSVFFFNLGFSLILYAALNLLLKTLFNPALPPWLGRAEYLFRTIRYCLIIFALLGIYPMCFEKLTKRD